MCTDTPKVSSTKSSAIFAVEDLLGRADEVAPRLLGAVLQHTSDDGSSSAGVIVEVEAYSEDEAACHGFRGKTARNAGLFGRAGDAYVYRSYGLHWCVNVVCGPEDVGAAILLRALEPVAGLEIMTKRRLGSKAAPNNIAATQLCRGPGNLTCAMGIDRRYDQTSLLDPGASLKLLAAPQQASRMWRQGPRIGISKATALPWRFFFADSIYVSHRGSSKRG